MKNQTQKKMNRRQAIKQSIFWMGAVTTLSSLGILQQSCASNTLHEAEIDWMNQVCDTLIPATTIGGAQAAGVGSFVWMMLEDCYSAEERRSVVEGLQSIQAVAKKQANKKFGKLTMPEREQILLEFQKQDMPFFKLLKQLCTKGYYSSEIGATKALAMDLIPGGFKACMPLAPEQRAWAM